MHSFVPGTCWAELDLLAMLGVRCPIQVPGTRRGQARFASNTRRQVPDSGARHLLGLTKAQTCTFSISVENSSKTPIEKFWWKLSVFVPVPSRIHYNKDGIDYD